VPLDYPLNHLAGIDRTREVIGMILLVREITLLLYSRVKLNDNNNVHKRIFFKLKQLITRHTIIYGTVKATGMFLRNH
jgi:hypothetical protein